MKEFVLLWTTLLFLNYSLQIPNDKLLRCFMVSFRYSEKFLSNERFFTISWWIKCKNEFELFTYKVVRKVYADTVTAENGYTDTPWGYKTWHQMPIGSIQLTTSSSVLDFSADLFYFDSHQCCCFDVIFQKKKFTSFSLNWLPLWMYTQDWGAYMRYWKCLLDCTKLKILSLFRIEEVKFSLQNLYSSHELKI